MRAAQRTIVCARRGIANREVDAVGKYVGLDVIIIGGGAVGVSSAYFLQQAGMRVTLIEQSRVGANAPRAPFVDCVGDELSTDLAKRGKELLFPLFEDLGYNMRLVSRFCFTSQSTITANSVRRGTRADELLMHDMLMDMKNIVNDRGGRIFEGLQVSELMVSGGKVVGVSTTGGQFLADETVIAAGVLSARFEGCLGLDLKLKEERVAAGDDMVNVPITPLGKPYVVRPAGKPGAIMAVGHDVNAICALAVGRQVAELVSCPVAGSGFEPGVKMPAQEIPWAGV
ncbi:FAD-binding oxidoreductase [Pseudomonas sp. 17391]|uniref:NAD(P)/FAD-dependent oxidoreductase n=1 Tax=Pseudomonas TaxID=286 RepID=UPI001CED3B91|nr:MULTISPECIES: FAD-binding oxidoreductase [Pseudomonas]MDD2130848.1 FAD-binding oxidoreductase [Pseudomonas sp. 17391]